MKKMLQLLALSMMIPAVMQGQNASTELVSKRLADAINSGKFYMKTGGSFRTDNDGEVLFAEMQMETAVKDGVSMSRTNANGANSVSLSADGYVYILDEAKKTYTPQAVEGGQQETDKLTFVRQGTCQLNGIDYYYDEWKTAGGIRFVFYYNSKKVAAIEMTVAGMSDEEMSGPLSLLSFNSSIPKNMYFCLGREWKKGSAGGSAMGDMDYSAYIPENIEGMEELPEGIDLNALMSGKMDQKALIKKHLKEEDLPEGMSMDDVMSMMGGMDMSAMMKNLTPEQKRMMEQQGVDMSAMQSQNDMYNEAMEMQQKQQAMASNAPEPPRCDTPWVDNTQGVELATGVYLGELTMSGKRPTARDSYVYMADFEDAPAGPRLDLNVTDEGVWLAFEEISKEIENMTDEEAVAHVDAISGDALTCAEIDMVTGQIVERAVAACMIYPSSYTYNNAGMLFVHINDDSHALDYFKQAEKIDPENPAVLTNIADCYLASDNTAEVEKYVAKALMFAPDYGPALQMRTTLLLKQGKFEEAVKALFHCAAYYFSDVTAAQFGSLMLQMQAIAARMEGNEEENFKEAMDRLMSAENKALLKKATIAGFNKQPQAGQPDHRKFDFTFEPASIMYQHKSLEEMSKAYHNEFVAFGKRIEELTKNDLYELYFAMGMGNLYQTMGGLETELNKVAAVRGQVDMTSGLPGTDAYETLCKAKGLDGGVSMLDARQFWCMMIWKTYYEMMMLWASGQMTNTNEFVVSGSCPESFRAYMRTAQRMDEKGRADRKAWEKSRESCAYADNEIAFYKCLLACNRPYHSKMYANEVEVLGAMKLQYERDIQPILEEYWATVTELTGYCNDATIQEFFYASAMCEINAMWPWALQTGYLEGRFLASQYQAMIIELEKMIGERISELKVEEAKRREALKSKDARLKNYGEKDGFDFGSGIPTPFGYIGFLYSEGDMNLVLESKKNGATVTTIKNLSKGTTTTMTTYKTLADEAREKKKKSPFDWLKDKGKDKAVEKVVDKVGRMALNTTGLSKFKIGTEQIRQHARSTDRMGNTIDTGDVQTRKFMIGGVGPVSATATETRHRSGNSLRTKNHLTVNFGGVDFTFGR